jgi:hypothetical protein
MTRALLPWTPETSFCNKLHHFKTFTRNIHQREEPPQLFLLLLGLGPLKGP